MAQDTNHDLAHLPNWPHKRKDSLRPTAIYIDGRLQLWAKLKEHGEEFFLVQTHPAILRQGFAAISATTLPAWSPVPKGEEPHEVFIAGELKPMGSLTNDPQILAAAFRYLAPAIHPADPDKAAEAPPPGKLSVPAVRKAKAEVKGILADYPFATGS